MEFEVPPSRRRTCVHCACMVDSNGMGIHKMVQGWIPCYERKRRTAANSITFAKDLDRYICEECYGKLKRGIPPGQMNLFGGSEYA